MSMKCPCLASTWVPFRTFILLYCTNTSWSKLSASWCCNGWDTNCLNTYQSFNIARSLNETIIFIIAQCIHYFKNQNNIHTYSILRINRIFLPLKNFEKLIVVVMHGWVCYWHVHNCSGDSDVHRNPLAIFLNHVY